MRSPLQRILPLSVQLHILLLVLLACCERDSRRDMVDGVLCVTHFTAH